MNSMNNICKNRSALAPPPWKSRDQQQNANYVTTTSTPTETITDDILDVFNTTSTISETTSADYTNSTSGVATISTDRFLNAATSNHVDTDFYIAENGTTNVSVATSFYNSSLANQFTTAVSATYSAGKEIRSKISQIRSVSGIL